MPPRRGLVRRRLQAAARPHARASCFSGRTHASLPWTCSRARPVPLDVVLFPADRISALPDDVLRRVLSQLSSREAVHTCLLAQRWRDLWRSVPIIDVSFEEFEDRAAENNFEREVMFKQFVNRFLMLRNPVGLDEFRLRYCLAVGTEDLNDSSADANPWISHVLQWNAWSVKVVNQENPLELVPAVFSSTLLKKLHISSATLVKGFFHQLRMACTALEYLFLEDCGIMDLEIFSSTLKVLILSDEIVFNDQASISAPSLISLCIKGDLGSRLPILTNMASLETASVLLSGDMTDFDADAVRQLLAGLFGVRSFDFCYGDRKLKMEKNFRWCPTFSNLINLTLYTCCVHADFYALIVFLQNSPSLKKLTLKLKQGGVSEISGELEDRSFTCEQLEIVEIICSKTSELLPRVTQFFRASGISPDQMRISHRN